MHLEASFDESVKEITQIPSFEHDMRLWTIFHIIHPYYTYHLGRFDFNKDPSRYWLNKYMDPYLKRQREQTVRKPLCIVGDPYIGDLHEGGRNRSIEYGILDKDGKIDQAALDSILDEEFQFFDVATIRT